jgi:hypothetical protein
MSGRKRKILNDKSQKGVKKKAEWTHKSIAHCKSVTRNRTQWFRLNRNIISFGSP